MSRVLELARTAPYSSPNPRVAAVLVRGNEILAEGVHRGPGTTHAEAAALEGVHAGGAQGATLYVNLEPCDHQGLTPPCAPALAEAGVARVVIAINDPDPRVAGRGIDRLRRAGVRVDVGVLADDAAEVAAAYVHHRSSGRPLVRLKLALTLDGRLAAPDGSSRWITASETRKRVHEARREADVVMVGVGTIAADDPDLTVRAVQTTRQPQPLVVDAKGRLDPRARIFDAGSPLVATTELAPHETAIAWKEAGAEVMVVARDGDRVDLHDLIDQLGRRGVLSLYCEGGPRIATSLLRASLVDRLELHHGPKLVGGGPMLGDLGITTMHHAIVWDLIELERVDDDIVAFYRKRA